MALLLTHFIDEETEAEGKSLSKVIQLDNAETQIQTLVFLISEHSSLDSRPTCLGSGLSSVSY